MTMSFGEVKQEGILETAGSREERVAAGRPRVRDTCFRSRLGRASPRAPAIVP